MALESKSRKIGKPDISIILPVSNQAGHIQSTIEEYEEILRGIPHTHEEILVVNASCDKSLEICRGLEATYSSIRTFHCERGGWGRAVRFGLEVAHGDVLCYTNSARTYGRDLILLILCAIANPNHVVKASRKMRGSWIRRIGSLSFNVLCRLVFDLPYWDLNGTPKVFPRQYAKLLLLERDDDLIDLEFNIICRSYGYPVLEVPIFSTRRHSGKSTTTFHSAIKIFIGTWRIWQQRDRVSSVCE